jgi:hypothetical protein
VTPWLVGGRILFEGADQRNVRAGRVTFPNCECVGVPSGAFVRLASVLFVRDSIFE